MNSKLISNQSFSMFLRYANFNDPDEDYNIDLFNFYIAM